MIVVISYPLWLASVTSKLMGEKKREFDLFFLLKKEGKKKGNIRKITLYKALGFEISKLQNRSNVQQRLECI